MVLLAFRSADDETLVPALLSGEPIQSLNLSWCDLNDDADVVADFVCTRRDLVQVDLNGNKIGLRSAIAIAKAVRCSVRRLSLLNNCVGNEGAAALMEALDSNPSMDSLSLGCRLDNCIFSEACARIEALENCNRTLIPGAVRDICLSMMGIRNGSNHGGMGSLAIFPKEIVKIIAMEV